MSSQDSNQPDPEARVTEVVNATGVNQHLGPGFKLKGRYLIERELGRGGIGVVYLARDERLHAMPVVIKFLLEASGSNAWLATKFLQEAEALTRINHPGVVKVIDRDTSDDGRPFFVMEFVAGRSLRSLMKPEGMELAEAGRILKQIGHSLGAAHQHGIVHRDLKPENILLQHLSVGEEQVKLIDFGIAKVLDSQSGAATEVSVIAGSLQYIAPEQLESGAVTSATDVYALAIVAYEMLTGRRPFDPTAEGYLAAVQQVALWQRDHRFVDPREIRPDLPQEADELIRRALSYASEQRPQDARLFGDQLAKALGEVSSVTPENQPLRPSSQGKPQVAPETTEVLSYSSPQPVASTDSPQKKSSMPKGAVAAVLSAVVLVSLALAFFGVLPRLRRQPDATPAGSSGQSIAASPELSLIYSVTVQKDPKRYPGSKPFQIPGEVIFSPGDRIHLNFSSSQSGHLYIINEGPADKNGAATYNALFPPVERKSGSALASNDAIRLPERGDGFVFDAEEGVEKLWIIFSASPVQLLESVKRWANPDDAGRIGDLNEVDSIRKLLQSESASPPLADKNEESKQTILSKRGPLLVRLVRMEHH
jgi:serine/threonine protein kinase